SKKEKTSDSVIVGGTEKFMIGIEHIRKKSLKHKKLPLWNICFHINDLYQIPEAITTSFQQLSSVFKEPSQRLCSLATVFFGTDQLDDVLTTGP
ncbi:MAG TPA: hypothetical protein DDY17_03120, partial [Syntrophaceae bacterium]|nr:hypothetical protein [Syntrophaceae bacterium]